MTATRPRTLRESMPKVFAWIEDLRGAFGADEINTQIKRGMAGEVAFYASEGGHSVGTPYPERGTAISAAQMVIQRPTGKAPDANR